MKIGIVDLDTSHPENWIPIERELGHEIIGLWDGGAIHPTEYAKEFAARFDIPHVYTSLENMAAEVDCAVIHSCDWDTHIDKARPFVEAGVSVLMDKPLAGNLADLQQCVAWALQGAKITGGSCLRFAQEVGETLVAREETGDIHTVIAGCAIDEFQYGIHAYSLAAGLLGAGMERVRYLGRGEQTRVEIQWSDGRVCILVVGQTKAWLPFYATAVGTTGVKTFIVDPTKIYHAILEATLPYLEGKTSAPPAAMPELIEPELAALAVRMSMERQGEFIRLDEITDTVQYDGAAFAVEYRGQKYPES